MSSTAHPPAAAALPKKQIETRRRPVADRFMRRLLRVSDTDVTSILGAHRAFRSSVVVSGIRCLVTYLLVPIAVPFLSFAGVLAAPVGIILCIVAVVNGVVSVRRFWAADHRARWMYTGFMAVVFAVLGVAVTTDISRVAGLG